MRSVSQRKLAMRAARAFRKSARLAVRNARMPYVTRTQRAEEAGGAAAAACAMRWHYCRGGLPDAAASGGKMPPR